MYVSSSTSMRFEQYQAGLSAGAARGLLRARMGLTSAPATEAIMGVVPKSKAGVGSAVNDATRLLGGILGVAVIGSIYASFYASRLTSTLPTLLPADVARSTHTSVGAALTAAGQMADSGHPALALATSDAARSAFFHGFHAGNYVSAGVAVVGALLALAFLPAHPAAPSDDTKELATYGLPATATEES